MEKNNIISRTITTLRFPLIIGILFYHTVLTNVMIGGKLLVKSGEFPIHDFLYQLIGIEFSAIAVPMFFMISGYLFFKTKGLNTVVWYKVYLQKLRRRIKTVLTPYIVWNIVYVAVIWAAQKFMTNAMSGRTELISNYTPSDWFRIFWNIRIDSPIDTPLWYIRDMMIVMILSPFVYFLIKKMKILIVVFFIALWISGYFPTVYPLVPVSLVFFSLGAWLCIEKIDFVTLSISVKWYLLIIYLVLSFLNAYFGLKHIQLVWIHNLGITFGIFTAIAWVGYLLMKNRIKENNYLAGSSFFVYAYHIMPTLLVIKLWVKLVPMNEITMIMGFLLIPFIMSYLGVLLYSISKKLLGKYVFLLTGGR